jgi:tetratricopeptide (TPR) repeat protein
LINRHPLSLEHTGWIAVILAVCSLVAGFRLNLAEAEYYHGELELVSGNYSDAMYNFQSAINRVHEQPVFFAAQASTAAGMVLGATQAKQPWRNLPSFREQDVALLNVAANDLRMALVLSRNDSSFWSNLGWVESYLHNDRLALDAFRHAILADPQDEISRIGLGLFHERNGNSELAIDQYVYAIMASPSLVDSSFFCDYKSRNSAGARIAVSRAINMFEKVNPSPLVTASLAKLHAYDGQYQLARREYAKALRQLPGLSVAWSNLGLTDEALGDKNAAELDFRRALFIDAANRVAANRLAEYRLFDGKQIEANAMFVQVLVRPLRTVHADRTWRIYHLNPADVDDVIPFELLYYIQAPIEQLNICGYDLYNLVRETTIVPAVEEQIESQEEYCSSRLSDISGH